jgi:hypothetical protein
MDRNASAGPKEDNESWCPSAQPDMSGSLLLGVVQGTAERPRLAYLAEPQEVTQELLQLAAPVQPTEVFRFAAPCAGHGCQHFDGGRCKLVKRLVEMTPDVVDDLPPCRLRPRCRWWQEAGRAACVRCPLVVTENYLPTAEMRLAADPTTPT